MAGPRRPPRLEQFAAWLAAFGDAWEHADAEEMAGLFVLGATYQPQPFEPLIRGRRAIADHWRASFADLSGVQFRAQVLGAGDTYGVAHWRVSFRRQGGAVIVRDGVLLCALDPRGRCTSLRKWWHEGSDPPLTPT